MAPEQKTSAMQDLLAAQALVQHTAFAGRAVPCCTAVSKQPGVLAY